MNDNVSTLYALAHELLYLGTDGSPIYSDNFARLNREVYFLANKLFPLHGITIEEEATLCLSLLMSYNATAYDDGDKQERIQNILNRCWDILDKLPSSILKARLLTHCYGEVYDEKLLKEAHDIIDAWDKATLTLDQLEIIGELKNLEENPYPFEEVEE